MDIYCAKPAKGMKMMDLFSLDRTPARISKETQSKIEVELLGHFWRDNEEVYIIKEGVTDNGDPVIFCFVKSQKTDTSGTLMLLVLGERTQIYHIRNCYDEGEVKYGQAEFCHGNVLSYYDYYIVQRVSSRHFFCFYDDDTWVKVNICADYSDAVGEDSKPSEDFVNYCIEVSVNGDSYLVEDDEFYPEISPDEAKVICDRILAALLWSGSED